MRFPFLHWPVLVVALAATPVWAQDAAHIVYKLQPGDTLRSLVARWMNKPQALQEIVKYNAIRDPNLVIAGDSLKIPRHLIRRQPSSAVVSRLNCNAITRIDAGSPVPVHAGDTLLEGHVVQIPAGCQMAVTLEDQSLLRLMSGAVIRFQTLRRHPLEAAPEVRVELLDGRLEVDVPRKRQPAEPPFEVRTPTSVAGVRGTEFRVGFDTAKRNSLIEVNTGEVAAQGSADTREQLARAGQGVVIQADGKSLPVEDMLAAPRYAGGTSEGGPTRWLFRFDPPAQAREFQVRHSQDASFAFFQSSESLSQPQITVEDFGSRTLFQQWSAVSASGIVGVSQRYAFCLAYLRQEAWRCNINFNMAGLANPHLRLLKLEASGQQVSIVDRAMTLGARDQLVFRGLPSGRYKWQIDHDLVGGRRASQSGEFELVTIPAEAT